jgi:hypothetical protein
MNGDESKADSDDGQCLWCGSEDATVRLCNPIIQREGNSYSALPEPRPMCERCVALLNARSGAVQSPRGRSFA